MGEALYNIIGDNYNETRTADPFIASKFYGLLNCENNGLYLDIGCGTGNYTIAQADRGLQMCGIDPSQKMLDIAKKRNSDIEWLLATAEHIPLEDNLFDGVLGMLTLHHWIDFNKAFAELYRVTKKGASIVFFTSTPEQMSGYWLKHYFPDMLNDSIEQMPSLDTIQYAACKAGFKINSVEKYFIKNDLQDHFLYVGKDNPQIYLNKNIRKGISSFAALSNAEEVEQGLVNLKEDIENGSIDLIRAQYENSNGDYLFSKFKR